MVKVYEISRYDGMQLILNWLGKRIHVEFKGGDARHRAKFVTENMFVQDAIENDSRFGSLVQLAMKFENTPKAKEKAMEKKKKSISRIKTVNDALRWFAENGYSITTDYNLDDLMEKANVEFPNLKK